MFCRVSIFNPLRISLTISGSSEGIVKLRRFASFATSSIASHGTSQRPGQKVPSRSTRTRSRHKSFLRVSIELSNWFASVSCSPPANSRKALTTDAESRLFQLQCAGRVANRANRRQPSCHLLAEMRHVLERRRFREPAAVLRLEGRRNLLNLVIRPWFRWAKRVCRPISNAGQVVLRHSA